MDTVQLLRGEAIVFFTPPKVPGAGPVLRPSVHATPGPSTNALGRKERRGEKRRKRGRGGREKDDDREGRVEEERKQGEEEGEGR